MDRSGGVTQQKPKVQSVARPESAVSLPVKDTLPTRVDPSYAEGLTPTWAFEQNKNLFFPMLEDDGSVPSICNSIFARAKTFGGEGDLCVLVSETEAWGIVTITPPNVTAAMERRVTVRWGAIHNLSGVMVVGPFQTSVAYTYALPMFWEGGAREPPAAIFDFDGDGRVEFVHPVIEPDRGSGGAAVVSAAAWTFHEGRIMSFRGIPNNVRAIKDLDADGRPDLLFPGPFVGRIRFDGQCYPALFEASASTSFENLFAIHTLGDGHFSTTDDVASRHAASWCAESPDLRHPTNEYQLLERVRCARMWSVPTGEIERAVTEFCASRSPQCANGERCLNPSLLRRWSNAQPPITFGHNGN